jgi:purine nucleosidase
VLDPSLFEVKQWPVCVETMGISRGKTWPGIGERPMEPWNERHPVNVCVKVDAEKMLELELSRLT